VTNPVGPATPSPLYEDGPTGRGIRADAYNGSASSARAGSRYLADPKAIYPWHGFRPVRTGSY
jgi:hypothetical protein